MHMSDATGNRVALVTGAGRGIGRELAHRLASLGWDVGLTARSHDELAVTAGLVRDAGRREVTVVGDVSEPGDVEAVCSAVEQGLGPIEVLVNNAAVVGEYASVLESDPADWWHVLEINTRGPLMFCRRLVPAMIERGSGYVVNVNSLDCSRSTRTGSPAYSVSKTALRRLTEILAAELEGTGVVAVDLSPGLVRTAMGGGRPDADLMPPEAWRDPSLAADKVEQLLSGRYDALHGRFLHAMDDLDSVAAAVSRLPEARMLRLVPAGEDDPMISYGAMTNHQEPR
jgi:NAD(P)-dependent dehydrogenase (short-subunit alcohol dehydrogenase family)